jgi:hypothetical protein
VGAMLDKIPFLHRGNAYHIIIEDDISFTALHYILDELIDQGAFNVPDDCAMQYMIAFEDINYIIGVDGMNVIIANR